MSGAEYADRWWKPLRPNCEFTYTQPVRERTAAPEGDTLR